MKERRSSLKGGRAEVATQKIEITSPYEVTSLPMKTLKVASFPAISTNLRSAVERKKSPIENVKPHIPEILKYHTNVLNTPASPACLDALEKFRLYIKPLSYDERSQHVYNLLKTYLLPKGVDDGMEQYNNYEKETNSFKNSMLLKYLQSLANYNSAEEFLYAGSLVSTKKNAK